MDGSYWISSPRHILVERRLQGPAERPLCSDMDKLTAAPRQSDRAIPCAAIHPGHHTGRHGLQHSCKGQRYHSELIGIFIQWPILSIQ